VLFVHLIHLAYLLVHLFLRLVHCLVHRVLVLVLIVLLVLVLVLDHIVLLDMTLMLIIYMFVVIMFIVYFDYISSIVRLYSSLSTCSYSSHSFLRGVSGRYSVSMVLRHIIYLRMHPIGRVPEVGRSRM
jgi:hypothetical protein